MNLDVQWSEISHYPFKIVKHGVTKMIMKLYVSRRYLLASVAFQYHF